MRTLFETRFHAAPWGSGLGQAGALPTLPELIKAGGEAAGEYLKTQQSEEERKKAQAEAEKAKAEAERAQAERGVAPPGMTLGIPRDYLVLGGIGVALLAVIVAVAK